MQSLSRVRYIEETNKRVVKFFGEAQTNRRVDSRSLQLLLKFFLFAKHAPTHFKNGLEPFAASLGVLPESFDADFFQLVLHLLPSCAECGDLGFLLEVGLLVWQ